MNIVMTGDGLGGVWNHVLELAHGLERADGTIYLVVFGGKLSQTQRAEVSRLSHVHCTESELRLEWMEDPWEDVNAGAQLLYGLVTKVKPAVIHLNGYALAAESPMARTRCSRCSLLCAVLVGRRDKRASPTATESLSRGGGERPCRSRLRGRSHSQHASRSSAHLPG